MIALERVASLQRLTWAFELASKRKRLSQEVLRFRASLGENVARISNALFDGSYSPAPFRTFPIRDPKARTIRAPTFGDRVVHHALMADVGPILDRTLVDDTFACRTGKGSLAAVQRAQEHGRRWPWFVQVDVRRYFDAIDLDILRALIARVIKGPRVMELIDAILCHGATSPGKGLPIGTLPSQHFANFYLARADRWLANDARVQGFVRYMDDIVWWCASRRAARSTLEEFREFLRRSLDLVLKENPRIQRSEQGLAFLGFRIYPGTLRLSLRRKRSFIEQRRAIERAYQQGDLTCLELQREMASVLAPSVHAQAASWRRTELLRHGTIDA